MNMDILRWYKLNPKVVIKPTSNKFYNLYNYKLVYKVDGARAIPGSKTLDQLNLRMSYLGGISRHNKGVVDRELIGILFDIYRDAQIRFRVEGNSVSMFCSDIDLLYHTASHRLAAYTNNLTQCSLVLSDAAQKALDGGQIIVNKPPEFRYKVLLRQGFYRNLSERQAAANYIEQLGSDIKISKLLLNNLKSSTKYLSAGYFYTNDRRLGDIIMMICPRLILSIRELVEVN